MIWVSFIQMMVLFNNFPIAWPAIFVTLFKVGGAITVIGKHIFNLKCMVGEATEAQVLYYGTLSTAVSPVLLLAVNLCCWYMVYEFQRCCRCGGCGTGHY